MWSEEAPLPELLNGGEPFDRYFSKNSDAENKQLVRMAKCFRKHTSSRGEFIKFGRVERGGLQISSSEKSSGKNACANIAWDSRILEKPFSDFIQNSSNMVHVGCQKDEKWSLRADSNWHEDIVAGDRLRIAEVCNLSIVLVLLLDGISFILVTDHVSAVLRFLQSHAASGWPMKAMSE